MTIMVDVDNVLNDLQKVTIELFNRRYNTQYSIDDFHSYNIEECLNKEDAVNMKNIYSEKGIYNFVSPLTGATSALQKFMREGHEVYLVTDAIPCVFEEKVNWIHHHFSFIDDSHIVSMKHKWLFRSEIMIEDNLNNLLGKPYYDRICFDYPWNRNTMDDVYGIYRCSNWNDIIAAVNKICNEESGIN